MIIYHMPASAMNLDNPPSPEEREKGMQQWYDWRDQMGEKLIDFGAPLAPGVQLKPDGSTTKSSSDVAGYSIIQAEDMESAKKSLKGHPHLGWNADCDIEVHEFMEM